jgi:hypothetical protein
MDSRSSGPRFGFWGGADGEGFGLGLEGPSPIRLLSQSIFEILGYLPNELFFAWRRKYVIKILINQVVNLTRTKNSWVSDLCYVYSSNKFRFGFACVSFLILVISYSHFLTSLPAKVCDTTS